jgi:rod shape determining protein RodA
MLYREGLSGWFLTVIGLAILIFILTLTASPYTAILTLTGLILLANVFHGDRAGRFLLWGGLYVLAMAFFPRIWDLVREMLIPGAGLIGSVDRSVELSILRASSWTFLLKIKPLYILIASGIISIPFLLAASYRRKSKFLFMSVLGWLAGVVMVFSADFIFNDILQDHQRKRIEVLLGMKEDPAGVGYNVNQSMIAIGSGGLTGKGFLNGTQTTYGFVPEQSTDFIFCTVGEEWGFAGCLVVIVLYVMLIWRILLDAERSREHFTRIYGYCVASCLFMHLFINIGMTIGLMPVIGIPLPMMSYGGSSLWAFTVLIFIFVVLDHEEKKYF